MYSLQCTVYIVKCQPCRVQYRVLTCKLYSVHCSVYIIHCSLYTVYSNHSRLPTLACIAAYLDFLWLLFLQFSSSPQTVCTWSPWRSPTDCSHLTFSTLLNIVYKLGDSIVLKDYEIKLLFYQEVRTFFLKIQTETKLHLLGQKHCQIFSHTMNWTQWILLNTQCTLHTALCILHTSHYTLYTTHCSLQTAHCTRQTAHFTLYTAHFTLHTAYCSLHTAHSAHCWWYSACLADGTSRATCARREAKPCNPCTPYTVHLTLHTTPCTPHITHYTLYTSHYTLHPVHLTLHTTPCTPHITHYTLYTSH